MRLKGKYRIPELARLLNIPVWDLRRTMAARRMPVHGSHGGRYVWLSDLEKYMPEAVETLRVLAAEAA